MKNKTGLLFLIFLMLINPIFSQEASKEERKLSFWEIPDLQPAFMTASPSNRQDGILVGELGVDGGNKTMILQLAQEIADQKHDKFDSFLIHHKGKLLFESYYKKGRINLAHPQASATKAYTCLLVGRAIQLGYLSMADLDKPLISFLKGLDPKKLVAGADKITLHKALTMRSGIRISDEDRAEIEKDTNQMQGQGEVQMILERSAPISAASQTFKYGGDPMLVMQVIEAVVPGSAQDFIKTELLDKLGIKNYEWNISPNGLPESGWKVSMTSRSMLKFGILAMNKGQWKGEQLVPAAYIKKALNRILLTGDDDIFGGGKDVSQQGYGYYWWSGDLKYGDNTYFAVSAQGGGGQYIVLIEDLDLMIVATAIERDSTLLQMIAERVIPAFVSQ